MTKDSEAAGGGRGGDTEEFGANMQSDTFLLDQTLRLGHEEESKAGKGERDVSQGVHNVEFGPFALSSPLMHKTSVIWSKNSYDLEL
jgi:hypothetical protein